jgi:excisionase family DNA binding protein
MVIQTPSLRPCEVARMLDVSEPTVRRWLASGRLPGVRVGGRLRVDPTAVVEFVKPAGPPDIS